MEAFPDDVIIEILLRCSVEALLLFRCVSKRWRSLIDSPNFVKSYLNLPEKPQLLMMVVFAEKLRIYYSVLDSDYTERPLPKFKELPIPIFSNIFDVVGHCNGLLCCVRKSYRSFLVLNPFTGKHIHVAAPEQRRCTFWAWGFGYDSGCDDYKVVALSYYKDRVSYCGVLWIYSLKSGTWKNIVDFPYISVHTNGVFVNGALHWIVHHYKDDPARFIFVLNLGTLEYFSVPRPSDYGKNLSHLGVLDGRLYAIYSDYHDLFDGYDLWVMEEYGMEGSWARLSTCEGLDDVRELLLLSYGNSLVQYRSGLFLKNVWNNLPIGKRMGKPLVYEPSLVCPRGGM